MSFTSIVKTEISKLTFGKAEIISELSAILKNIGVIDKTIKITTENASLARKIFSEIKEMYNVSSKITVRRGYNFNKTYLYILDVHDKINDIIIDLDLEHAIPSSYLIDDISLKKAYLRGIFLSTGSINDPKKSRYHLEFVVDSEEYANFISSLLNEFFLNSKVIKRENKYMIYIKEAEKIGDFLRITNATNALLYYEDIRIYRENKNMTNRLNNCEQANVDKTIMAASNQIKDIEFIKEKDAYDLLDDKLKTLVDYRIKYPDVSLQELSDIMSHELNTKITKSGLNHRFTRLKEFANKLRK